MFERASGGPPAEMPPSGSMAATGPITDLSDARTLQILFTEHWSLLATRSLIYNETFTRTSIFVTAVTGSVLALGFVAQASGFVDEFGWFAVLVLVLDLVLGIGTLLRLRTLTLDDFRYVQAMNRLRHGYLDVAPDIRRYFMMSAYDDARGVLSTYGGLPGSNTGRGSKGKVMNFVHGLTTVTAAVGAVVALLVGAIVGMILVQTDFGPEVALTAGVVAFVSALLGLGLVGERSIADFVTTIDASAEFPDPDARQET
jgi:hypothetical protein